MNKTSMRGSELTYYLDVWKQIPIQLSLAPFGENDVQITATMKPDVVRNRNLREHLKKVNVRVGDESVRLMPRDPDKPYEAALILPKDELLNAPLEIAFNQQRIGTIHVDTEGAMVEDTDNERDRLSVFETRGLTHQYIKGFPYSRDNLKGFDAAQHAPTTDLHTHLTSQISADDLITLAQDHDALYPVELLNKLGISNDKLPHYVTPLLVKSQLFAPTAQEGLACETLGADGKPQDVPAVHIRDLSPEARRTLRDALTIPIDKIYTFDGLERSLYRFRNPLTKNPDLIEPVILKIAEDYQQQGVTYTEQSVTGALNTAWLEKALPALEKAEQNFGVRMRFLIGIPRTLPHDAMQNAIEQTKIVAESPYIAGIDFLGYESNKTTGFEVPLKEIAQWASDRDRPADNRMRGRDFEDDFVLRVHAGENGKNGDNVKDALRIAQSYGVRMRIGHGVYVDMDDELRQIVQDLVGRNLLTVEFNPDSNMALNNIDFASDIPIKAWREMGVPVVLATDGGGAYQTTLKQSAVVGLHAGLTLDDLGAIRTYEQEYIGHQEQLFTDKKAAYEKRYGNAEDPTGLKVHLAACQEFSATLPKPAPLPPSAKDETNRTLPPELKSRTPLLIAGASGNSWKNISPRDRADIDIGISMLVELLDPEKVYFAAGRIKDEGITNSLDHALTHYHHQHPATDEHFSLVGLLSNHQLSPHRPSNLSHLWPLDGGLMGVPTEMMQFIAKRNGAAIFAGGSAFTRDFIHLGEEMGMQFGVMRGPAGASTEKARVLDKNTHLFKGAVGMVKQVIKMQHEKGVELFREGVALDEGSLKELYAQKEAIYLESHPELSQEGEQSKNWRKRFEIANGNRADSVSAGK